MFRVGQKVVCVDDAPPPGFETYKMEIVRGRIYSISETGLQSWLDGEPAVRLVDVRRHTPFWASRFRPVVERKTDISIFTAMLTPNKTTVRA